MLNVFVLGWAFLVVPMAWPALGPAADGSPRFAAPDHIAYKVEMAYNLLTALAASYVCALVAGRREWLHAGVLLLPLLIAGVAYMFGLAGEPFASIKPMWAHVGTELGLILGMWGGVSLRLRQKG
jgi:hypothetical protein